MIYKIKNKTFKNHKSAHKYLRSIINSYNCQKYTNDNFEFYDILDIIRMNKNIKKTDEIKVIEIYKNYRCDSNHIKYFDDSNELFYFSWSTIFKEKTPRQMFSEVMRNIIYYQIQDFRKYNKFVQCCYNCNIMSDKLEVDHIIPFSKLRNDFMKLHPEIKKQKPYLCQKTNMYKFHTKANTDYLIYKWKDYHKQNSQLSFLCSKCNLQKSNKY